MNQRVPGHGPLDATICLIGGMPSTEDTQAGRPFAFSDKPAIYHAGNELMHQWIRAAGIDPDSIRLEHVCEYAAPNCKFNRIQAHPDYLPPNTIEGITDAEVHDTGALGWLDDLRTRLDRLPNLKVIGAIGSWPARLLLERRDIESTKHRGSCFLHNINGRDITIVPMLHPTWVLEKKLWDLRLLCMNDAIKIRKIAAGFDWQATAPQIHAPTDHSDARYCLLRLKKLCNLYPARPLAIDTETLGQSIDTISFGFASPVFEDLIEGLAIGFQGEDMPCYIEPLEFDLWRLIAEILDLPNPKVFQNGQYDLRFLSDMGIGVRNVWWDTKYASHALHPGLGSSTGPIKPRALDTLVSLYTYLPYYKDERVGFGKLPLKARWQYAATDAAATLMVANEQSKAITKDPDLLRMFLNISMPQLVPYHRMEVNGVGVDKKILSRREKEIQGELGPLGGHLTELRCGEQGVGDWTVRVEETRERIKRTEDDLDAGRILDVCKSCDGRGGRVVCRGKKEPKLVYTPCNKCGGSGEQPTRLRKSILRKLNSELNHLLKDKPNFNVNSSKQMTEWLYTPKKDGGLGFRGKPKQTAKTNNPSSDANALQSLLLTLGDKDERREILEVILQIRTLGTELSNFVDLGLSADGRFRTQCQPLETTGRVASREDAYGDGRNFQNFPRVGAAKQSIIPPPGHVIVGFDYKQIEALIVAWDAGDTDFITAVQGGQRDVHSEATEMAFGITQSDYTPNKWKSVWRQAGKRIRHGFNYGMGVRTMREQLLTDIPGFKITQAECKTALNRLAAACPLEERRKAQIIEQVKTTRRMTTPFGRVIRYYQPWDSHIEKAALAYRPQSTAGDILNRGLVNFHTYWIEHDSQVQVMATIHDAVKWSCPESMVMDTLRSALYCWADPLVSVDTEERRIKGPLVCPMEFSSGPNLNDQEEMTSFNDSISWSKIQTRLYEESSWGT